MSDEQPPASANPEFTAEIVAAYFQRNQVAADQIPALISTVHEALCRLGKPFGEPAGERTPAVSIRRSVHHNYVVCLDCGYRGQMLRRHIATAHGLTVDAYRARWGLQPDHPITAPGYSERRSALAKQLGLGRPRRASGEASAAPESPPAPQPRRRGRPPTPRS